MYRFKLLLFLAAVASLFTGCGLHKVSGPGENPTADIELTNTPFFPQKEYQCGPAALAALLVSADVATRPDLLTPDLYIPGRQGTLQLEIIGAIRRHNLVPYEIKPRMTAITAELQAGRPVLVLQNLGLKILPTFHYAVVIGQLRDGRVILRSGVTERLIMEADDFLRTWEIAGSWGVIALKPDQLPADGDISAYLEAVAGLEATGNAQLAGQCYSTVLYHHPRNDLAVFGLANTLFAQHRYTAAAAYYSSLLKRNPAHAEAVNNLAETLAALHCYQQAITLLDDLPRPAATQTGKPAFLSNTRQEIKERLAEAGGISADCSKSVGLIDL